MLRARARALEDANEAQLAEELGVTYDIRHNVGVSASAAQSADSRAATAMLGTLRGPLPDDGVMRAPNPAREAGAPSADRTEELTRRAMLCAGSGVALDLGGAGFASLLGDEAAATGVPVRSMDLAGLDGGAGADGAPRLAEACLVPLAVCGEGRSGSVRLQWRRQIQRLGPAGCEPDMREGAPSGDGFVPLARLAPADADLAGLALAPCQGPCHGGAAEGLVLPVATSPYRAPRDVTVFMDGSSPGTSLPMARQAIVAGLRQGLNSAFAADGDSAAMQKLAAGIAAQQA